MTDKTYVMVTGTNQSGSTLIGAILGNFNDYTGLDAGEIHAVLAPSNERHRRMKINPFWKVVKDHCTEHNWIQYLHKHVDYIVDSSKMVHWFIKQNTEGATVKHVHVYTHPKAWMQSRINREHLDKEEQWNIYVRQNIDRCFVGLGEPDATIYLRDIQRHPLNYTRKLCKVIDMPYWFRKQDYWLSSVRGMFGSPKTRNNREIIPPSKLPDIDVPDRVTEIFERMEQLKVRVI